MDWVAFCILLYNHLLSIKVLFPQICVEPLYKYMHMYRVQSTPITELYKHGTIHTT